MFIPMKESGKDLIKINQQLKRIEIKEFEIENQIVFNYFDNLPAIDRDDKLLRAIYIGVLALMEDRISSFLSKTSNELGTELESLKMIFEKTIVFTNNSFFLTIVLTIKICCLFLDDNLKPIVE